jgi:hypothetical protein
MTKIKKPEPEHSLLKVIPFDKKTEREKLTDAAWNFVSAALWPREKFRTKEIASIKKIIAYYLSDDKYTKQSFRIFIEAVVLYRKQFLSTGISHPLVWLNQAYDQGFTKALECYKRVEETRKSVPLYEHAVSILSNSILKYTIKSTSATIIQCRNELLFHKDDELIRLFYFHIIHRNHIP